MTSSKPLPMIQDQESVSSRVRTDRLTLACDLGWKAGSRGDNICCNPFRLRTNEGAEWHRWHGIAAKLNKMIH